MHDEKVITAILAGAVGMAAVIVLAGAITFAPRPAMANVSIGQKTGQPCTKCHTKPPALNAYGKKYKEGLKK
jgi:hypothetical protein